MITLHTMPRIGWGHLNPSPFCMKVEVWMRLAGVEHRVAPTLMATRAPRKKLPWIELEGRRLADSEVIITTLARDRGDPLGDAGGPTGSGHLLRRTFEESFYFGLVAERWLDETVKRDYTAALLAGLPAPLRPLTRTLAERALARQLWEQGTGRRPLAEIAEGMAADLTAASDVLSDAMYFGGDTPRALDATMYSFLSNVWHIPVETRSKRVVSRLPRLVAYLDRMERRLGPA